MRQCINCRYLYSDDMLPASATNCTRCNGMLQRGGAMLIPERTPAERTEGAAQKIAVALNMEPTWPVVVSLAKDLTKYYGGYEEG